MESQKELLKSILQNQLDRANLLSNLRKYKVSFDEESSFVILKYKLKLKLLENISHGDCDVNERVDIDRMKKETEEFLKFHNEKLSRVKFKCTLAGCLFECGKHRDYIRHLQRVHPQETNLGCQYGFICKSAFASISLMLISLNPQILLEICLPCYLKSLADVLYLSVGEHSFLA